MNYHEFLNNKRFQLQNSGFDVELSDLNNNLFDFQKNIVKWCLKRGVLSPFMGIGSEGYVSIECGRKFIGIELKPSYYEQAVKNMESASNLKQQLTIPFNEQS